MIPIDILVATSLDFARLRNGRPVASGSWDDVVEMRAFAKHGGLMPSLRVVLRLRGGAEFAASDDAPGWDDLLDAAESALEGVARRREWWDGADEPNGVVLFTRPA